MWRKTRRPYSGEYGADPNRNFNYHFAGEHYEKTSLITGIAFWDITVFHRANNQDQMIKKKKKNLPLNGRLKKKKEENI